MEEWARIPVDELEVLSKEPVFLLKGSYRYCSRYRLCQMVRHERLGRAVNSHKLLC